MKTRTPLYGLLAILLILSLSSIFVVAEDKHDGSFFTEKKEEKKQEHPKVEKQKKGATHDMQHGSRQCQGNTVKTGELTKGECFAVVVTAAHCINATIGPHSYVVVHPDKTKTVFKHTDIDIHLPDGNRTLLEILQFGRTRSDMAALVIKDNCNTIKENFPEVIPIIPKEQVAKVCIEGAKICVQGRCNFAGDNLGGSWKMEGSINKEQDTHGKFSCQLEKCRAQSGDSGGPVTQEIEGKQTLVGVLSTSTEPRGPRTGQNESGDLPNCKIEFSKGLPEFMEQVFASITKEGTGESSPTLTKSYLERMRASLANMKVAKNFGYNPYKRPAEQIEKDWEAVLHYRNEGANPSVETINNIRLRYEQDLKQESLKEEKLEKNRVELESMNVLNLNAETVKTLHDWYVEHYLEVIRQELQRQRDSGNLAPTVHHMTIEEIFQRYVNPNPRFNEGFIVAQPVSEEKRREKKHSR